MASTIISLESLVPVFFFICRHFLLPQHFFLFHELLWHQTKNNNTTTCTVMPAWELPYEPEHVYHAFLRRTLIAIRERERENASHWFTPHDYTNTTHSNNFVSLLLSRVSSFLVFLLHEPLNTPVGCLLQVIRILPHIRLAGGEALPVRIEQVDLFITRLHYG